MLYDQPDGIEGAAEESWAAVREGIHAGAAASPAPVIVASTLPELLDDAAAGRFAAAGVPAVAGLRTGLALRGRRCGARRRPGAPARDRRRRPRVGSQRALALAEHEAKELLRGRRRAGGGRACGRRRGRGGGARWRTWAPRSR